MIWVRASRPAGMRGGGTGSASWGVGCGADLGERVGGELVGHPEPGAERVAGDRLPVGVVVLGGDAAGEVDQCGSGPGPGLGRVVLPGDGRNEDGCLVRDEKDGTGFLVLVRDGQDGGATRCVQIARGA